MKRFAKLLPVTFGFGVLGFALSLTPQKTATGATSTNVNVTNPTFAVTQATNPWTVSGSVGINNTAADPVPVSGTVTANVTFPSSLTVTMPSHLGINPSQFVALVYAPSIFSTWAQNTPDGGFNQPYSMPTGDELVVTDIVEFDVTGSSGDSGAILLGCATAPCLASWISPTVTIPSSSGSATVAAHLTSGIVFRNLPSTTGDVQLIGAGSLNLVQVSIQGYVTPVQ